MFDLPLAEAGVAIVEGGAAAAQAVGITGNLTSAFGCLGGALGVGIIGMKACESVGRNPGASGQVLVQSILAMALAEGVAILSLLMG